jgi:GT2 family glycosyltransferase
MTSIDLQIIIVNYNSTDSLLACLASIQETQSPTTPHIWVWDNYSKDNPGRIREQFPEVHLVQSQKNIGFGAAVNKGLAHSEATFHMLLNPDTVLSNGFFYNVFDYMAAHPDVGLLGPKIIDADGSLQQSARSFPNGLTGLFGRTSLLTRIFPNNPFSKKNLLAGQNDEKTAFDPDWVSGACMVVRREAILDAGPMDERFFMYWEDADWCRRIKEKGWRVVYYPGAEVSHFVGHSSRTRPIRASLEFHKSAYRLYAKHATGYKKNFHPLVFSLLALRFCLLAGRRLLRL